MMNPDMMRAAAEMMKNMKKEDLEAMTRQMQNMPSMPGMGGPGMPSPAAAAEMMKNMRPEDLQFMARQMESLPPEQLQRMAAQMGSGSAGAGFDPSTLSGAARVMQQRQRYELDAAVRLKEEGNKLHGAGKYAEASEKYSRARSNLSAHSTSEAASVRKACTLNLMSCNLKLGNHSNVVSLGDEILKQDAKNLKALYRRGQAHLKLGHMKSAVADLTEAAKITPDDDTLAGVLREAKEALAEKQALGLSGDGEEESKEEDEEEENKSGVTIEDVTEQEEREASSKRAAEQVTSAERGPPLVPPTSTGAPALGPEAIRNIQAMSSMPPEQVAALSGGRITPEMARMASSMVSQMGPEELQRMMDMAARFGAPPAAPGVPGANAAGAAPNVSWSARSTASERGSGSGSGSASASASARAGAGGAGAGVGSAEYAGAAGVGEDPLAALGAGGANPMEDPQMLKMMSDMMQSMSPEDLAAMSAQMGRPMTVEQARQTKEIMAKVGPQHLATMMKWSNKAQGAVQQARQALNWLLRQPALLIAILVVVIAVVGRWLGYF